MQKQQQGISSQSIIIPMQSMIRYRKLIPISGKRFRQIQHRQCLQTKHKTLYGVYSSESLIKLLGSIEQNSSQFMEIIAINTTLSRQNKKQFMVDKLLREYCQFSFQDLLNELHVIRQQLRDKQLYEQMIQFIKTIITKAKYLLYKHCQTLVMVLGQCLNFYIRRSIDHNGNYQYSLVIGLDRICISFCSSNQYCENIILCLFNKLREHSIIDGYMLDEKQLLSPNINASQGNLLDSQEIPQHFLSCYPKKQMLIEQKLLRQSQAEITYTTLILNLLTKYAQDIYFIIEGAIVFLTNLVLQKKQLKAISFDQQFISMHHPIDNSKTITETFMNLYCSHFQGLPQQLYKNGQKCPYCSQMIIVDQIKCYERNKNIFQILLARNFLNPKGDDVFYYFRDKVFKLATQEQFSSYAHFCQFFKKHYFVRDRPEVLMLLEHEKISLYSKLWGKKKLFSSQQLIQTPVRGKFCRHLQFFDLMRVYEKYLIRQKDETSFECFLCFEQIQYTELIYLHEISLLIDLARHNFYTDPDCLLNTYLQIDHTNETVSLCCEMQKGFMKKIHQLPIYETLRDPLTKSQKIQKKKDKKDIKIKDQEQFQFTEDFENFYFGH